MKRYLTITSEIPGALVRQGRVVTSDDIVDFESAELTEAYCLTRLSPGEKFIGYEYDVPYVFNDETKRFELNWRAHSAA